MVSIWSQGLSVDINRQVLNPFTYDFSIKPLSYPFKRQPYKMVRHAQTIYWLELFECV